MLVCSSVLCVECEHPHTHIYTYICADIHTFIYLLIPLQKGLRQPTGALAASSFDKKIVDGDGGGGGGGGGVVVGAEKGCYHREKRSEEQSREKRTRGRWFVSVLTNE